MRKDKLYLLTFMAIAIIFLIIASFGVKYFVRVSANQLIALELNSSVRESEEISKLIHFQLDQKINKELVINNTQISIKNTNTTTSFISVFDWSGKMVCHPDITKVGQKVNSNQSLLNSLKEENSEDQLYNLLIQENKEKTVSEIIHIVPIVNSDLIVAAHLNLSKIRLEVSKLKRSFFIIFLLMGIVIIISSFLAVRFIGSYYEKALELKNSNLENELISLSKLNTNLVAYQQKVIEQEETITDSKEQEEIITLEASKKRILTYIRNELVPIDTNEIAFIHTEDTITYVVATNGKKSTTNTSLDDLLTNLDSSLFFRANRQFIISIKAINKIIKYGNSQLKILIKNSEAEIVISKNKASEFRQWLNS